MERTVVEMAFSDVERTRCGITDPRLRQHSRGSSRARMAKKLAWRLIHAG